MNTNYYHLKAGMDLMDLKDNGRKKKEETIKVKRGWIIFSFSRYFALPVISADRAGRMRAGRMRAAKYRGSGWS